MEQTKDEAKKAQEQFNYYLEQQKREMEERRKREEQRMQEEMQKMQQAGQNGIIPYGINYYNPDYRQSRKRRQYNVLPFEDEIMELCVTCSCKIF